MQQPLMGDCGKKVSATFTASGTANGATMEAALGRAREQAQNILDAWMETLTVCPAACPVKDVSAEPDYDAGSPTYAPLPDAPALFTCTARVSRIVYLSCSTDQGNGTGTGP
jgi:hypothetical protein